MKTTKADFETFKAECERWISFFGLLDCETVVVHQQHPHEQECEAWCKYVYEAQYCEIGLCKEFPEALTCTVEQMAFHEVCHLLIGKMRVAAEMRFTTETEISLYEHEIVRRLENSVYKNLK